MITSHNTNVHINT